MLRVDVSKQLGEFSLSADFTSEGRVTGLFGASGAGKTSLINMIAGLLRPDRGVIALDGETLDDTAAGVHVPPHRRRIGYVFQDARLFPHLDVRQNLDYGRRMNRLPDDAAQRSRVTDLLDISGLLCCCWTSPWVRLTKVARSRSCPIWCGYATKPMCQWSMSATTPPRCASLRRRS